MMMGLNVVPNHIKPHPIGMHRSVETYNDFFVNLYFFQFP
jgi:hypothetical protein